MFMFNICVQSALYVKTAFITCVKDQFAEKIPKTGTHKKNVINQMQNTYV